jgi:hypothetical protein
MPCWHPSCIATDCDGINHVGNDGHGWAQARGAVYCPLHNAYHHVDACWWTATPRENERWRVFMRSGLTPEAFEAAEEAGIV